MMSLVFMAIIAWLLFPQLTGALALLVIVLLFSGINFLS